jgi:phosphoenolpyruvate synthase/pyruvate phosphate dikinase
VVAKSLSPVTYLDDPTSLDERAVGGKAANVAQMHRAGMQVPAGFCVTVAAYKQFLGAADLAQIIRRELGIPCVNGVVDAIAVLKDGELVTVDGYLGIVFIGKPEFDRERTFGGRAARAADR